MRKYDEYVKQMGRVADVYHAVGLMHWDTEIYMPSGGGIFRSRQIGTMTGIAHEMATSTEMGKLLDDVLASDDLSEDERRNAELSKQDYDKQVKLNKEFVEKMASAKSRAFANWTKARSEDNFAIFSDSLEELIKLKRQETEIRGFENEPYDTLLDLYEPGLRTAFLDSTFESAKEQIVPLIQNLTSREQPRKDFLSRKYDKDKQWSFGLEILKSMGYDMSTGRQDISAHPFTISLSPSDVRVTTRIDEHDFLNMTWSCIHEGGHALYEQGLAADQYGLPLGSAASLSIHESQSRLWENHIGRSKVFWEKWFPVLQEKFPDNLIDVTLDEFYKGINTITPNLIRTEADELHYHLHVIVRYEIERACMNGDVEVDALPDLWNTKYKEYLNVDVPSNADGILQDVHWSHGSFGYFPTYSLGSFYAAQFFETAKNSIAGIENQVRDGNYSQLLNWLRTNIHAPGRKYDPEDLCKQVTGEPLNVSYYMDYAKRKFEGVYGS